MPIRFKFRKRVNLSTLTTGKIEKRMASNSTPLINKSDESNNSICIMTHNKEPATLKEGKDTRWDK